MFGINGGEVIVLLIVAAIVVGPGRMPAFAEQLARAVKSVRSSASRFRADLAESDAGDSVDWSSLDPRKYDPRRIVRDALLESDGPADRPAPAAEARPAAATIRLRADQLPPWDDEAT